MSASPLPDSVPCGKCGGPIYIIGRTGGGAIAVQPHTCRKEPPKKK